MWLESEKNVVKMRRRLMNDVLPNTPVVRKPERFTFCRMYLRIM